MEDNIKISLIVRCQFRIFGDRHRTNFARDFVPVLLFFRFYLVFLIFFRMETLLELRDFPDEAMVTLLHLEK
jgi:hypothetical protein